MCLCVFNCREAVRQRKALSRTSSNILLNSVHMAHTKHNMHHSHHMNYLSPSDCDLNLTLKQMRRESNYSSTSNIEVSFNPRILHYSLLFAIYFFYWCVMCVHWKYILNIAYIKGRKLVFTFNKNCGSVGILIKYLYYTFAEEHEDLSILNILKKGLPSTERKVFKRNILMF